MPSIRKDRNEENVFWLGSSKEDGTEYKVDIEKNTCTCPAFLYNSYCKHLQLAKQIMQKKQPLTDEELEFLENNLEFDFDTGKVVLGEKRIAELVYLGEIYIKTPGRFARLK